MQNLKRLGVLAVLLLTSVQAAWAEDDWTALTNRGKQQESEQKYANADQSYTQALSIAAADKSNNVRT
ncbi:MAG: hypothetical protein KA255_20820, partial [Candidatus Obscuribacter sp.]|nr:hypothetical protein [Candidatus Obscuribacter sp.]